MGVFSDVFGIRPWEWDQLEAAEAMQLIAYIDEQNKKGADGGDV